MYVTYDYFKTLYGEGVSESDFNLVAFDACKLADKYTTGVDGVKKLKDAFPSDEDDAEAVKRVISGVIALMAEVKALETKANAAGDYITLDDGTIHYKTVASISSGSESMSFATGGTSTTLASTLLADLNAREDCYKKQIIDGFRGIQDANGVNLLFGGFYPYVME